MLLLTYSVSVITRPIVMRVSSQLCDYIYVYYYRCRLADSTEAPVVSTSSEAASTTNTTSSSQNAPALNSMVCIIIPLHLIKLHLVYFVKYPTLYDAFQCLDQSQ